MLQPENLMPSENRHHGESSRTALLSQNSAAKTARVDYQVVPLPQCHNRCATRALTLAILEHQNMKQSKRLQPAAEKAVVAAGCDYKSVETDASEATKCRRTSSAILAACSPTT